MGSQSQARAAPLHTHPPAFPARPSKRWALSGVARRRPPLLQLSPGEGSTQRQGCPASSGDRGRWAISRRLPRAIGGCWCGDEHNPWLLLRLGFQPPAGGNTNHAEEKGNAGASFPLSDARSGKGRKIIIKIILIIKKVNTTTITRQPFATR